MPKAFANGIELEYEIFGKGEPLILIMGIGAQMINWPDDFCKSIAKRGYQVIRFDNRDTGLSSKFHGAKVGNVKSLVLRGFARLKVSAPYTLMDMADDVAGLLSALAIDSAHIVGASLGGMVAQCVAILHPRRVKSLTSIMSHTGKVSLTTSYPKALLSLFGPRPTCREDAIQNAFRFVTNCGSKGFAVDYDEIQERAGRSYERCFYPQGFVRQLAALVATGDRTKALAMVNVPTAVIHGSDDTLIRPFCGRETAAAIPGATFRLIQGMGHDLPRGAWPLIIDQIELLQSKQNQ